MKKEDIARLKEICKKNGFIISNPPNINLFTVEKKDKFEVEWVDWSRTVIENKFSFIFDVPGFLNVKNKDEIGMFLAKQLETYLNQQPE